LVSGIALFTQQNHIKFAYEKYQNNLNRPSLAVGATPEDSLKGVLAENTSKLKLGGSIVFGLPAIFKEDVTLKKNLFVDGQGRFTGDLTAPNILYGVKAGTGIVITGQESQEPTIAVDTSGFVSSVQGETGDIAFTEGTDIEIDGLEISNISTLSTVAARGHCSGCLTDSDVVNNLTISSDGQISGTAVTSGIVGTTVGGTGLTTYVAGDMLYASAADTLDTLPIGSTNGQILQVNNGVPAWTSIALNATGSNNVTSGASMVGVFDEFVSANGATVQ
jgi:hypothetical protein